MADSTPKPSGAQKLAALLVEEVTGIHPRMMVLNLALGVLPRRSAKLMRARLYASFGFRIGAGTHLAGQLRINGGRSLVSNLIIGRDCDIGTDCVLDLEERITIGDRVAISPGVMILTSTHELDKREHRAGPVQRQPVAIGAGAWLGARCIILPGVTVGEGAIVNPGAVVNKDVVPQTRVGGTPAVQIEVLGGHEKT